MSSNCVLNLKLLKSKIEDYIKNNLVNVDLTVKYIKANRDPKMSDEESIFKKKFNLLYDLIKNDIKEKSMSKKLNEISKNILKIYPKNKLHIINNPSEHEKIKEMILKKYNVVKIIRDNEEKNWDNSLFIVKKNNKKYVLKIYYSQQIYYQDNYYLSNIADFNKEIERLKLAAKHNITPNIEDSYLMLYYNNTIEYYKGPYYTKVLLTEYIEGMNCEEYMKTSKFIESDIDKIKTLMKKLHSIGIFHGLIKPSNIIFNKNYKKTNTYKFLFVDFTYSNTCETISKSRLNNNIKSIEQLSVKYSDRDYIKIYISLYHLLKNKSINIVF